MPGLHVQLTSHELSRAIDATETLMGLEQFFDRLTVAKISSLHSDLKAEREDRDKARAAAEREAKADAGFLA